MSGTPVRPASTQEKIHRQKTKEGDTQAGYLQEKLVGSEYVTIVEEDGSVGKRLKVEVDASALGTAIDSGKVLVSTTDTTKDYLLSKLVAGNAITLTKQNPAGKENILIDGAYVAGAGISIVDDTIASTITQVVTEDPFTGHATKVPTSKAVAEFLQKLHITNATDCGSGGGSIMYKTISIPVSNSCICEGEQADFSDHYPSIFESFDILPNNNLTFAERSMGLKLITTETDPSDQGDGFGAVLLEAMIDEDCSDNNTIFLDTVILTKDNRGADAQTNLRCFAIGCNEDQVPKSSAAFDVKLLDNAGFGLIKKASFEIDLGAITASSPFSIKFILFSGSALIAADAGYQSVDEFTLLSARVRYPIKTINLRKADINM